jgi:hypothetical protein
MTKTAHTFAIQGDCEKVETLAYRVRSLSPGVYRDRFANDRAIINCDPRVARRLREADEHAALEHATGFWFGADLAIERVPTGFTTGFGGGSDTSDQTVLTPRVRSYLGYQGRSIAIGGTIVLQHDDADQPSQTGDGTMQTLTKSSILVGPAVRLSVWTSESRRLDVLLAGDLAAGYAWMNLSPDQFMQSPPKNLEVLGRLGFGFRYWLAPSFALGVTTGFMIAYEDQTQNLSQGESSGGITATTLDFALSVTGVL